MDLLQLRNLCKRDPPAYREEFETQLRHFESQLQIFQLKPSKNYKPFQEQVTFLSHVAPLYSSQMRAFPGQISLLLEQMADIMEPELRKALVKALILLRNRNLLQPIELLSLLFKLFRVPDKELRSVLYTHIISDIKNINMKHKNNKVNNALQNFMFKMMQDTSPIAAKKAHDVMIELYRRKIWRDAKAVNAISLGVFSGQTNIMVATIHFFLGAAEEDSDSESEDDTPKTEKEVRQQFEKSKGKKTRSKAKKLAAALLRVKKKNRKKGEKMDCNFAAIELLHDPQGYAEKCYRLLKSNSSKNSKNEKFEVRLMLMNLISRLIGVHKLIIMEVYPYFQKYLEPKQKNITYILAVVVQSCHELIPPESLTPIVRAIADKFVSDRSSNEAVAIGINTIREICLRCPLVMEADLLQDLAQYKRHKDKGVVMAARSIINLYQTINPSMLAKKDRGKDHDITAQPLAYGDAKFPETVPALDLLNEYIEQNGDLDDLQPIEEGESDEEGWVDVPNDEDQEEGTSQKGEMEESDEEEEGGEEGEDGDEEGGWMTVSEGEDEEGDEEGWIEVSDDEEECGNQEDQEEGAKAPSPQKKIPFAATTIITEELWEKAKILEERKKREVTSKKRPRDNTDSEIATPSDIVHPEDLAAQTKKARKTAEERMQAVLAGREGREYIAKKARKEKKGGTTNEEKQKHQPFMLVKHSKGVRGKNRRSMQEQQRIKRKHKSKMKNLKKYKH